MEWPISATEEFENVIGQHTAYGVPVLIGRLLLIRKSAVGRFLRESEWKPRFSFLYSAIRRAKRHYIAPVGHLELLNVETKDGDKSANRLIAITAFRIGTSDEDPITWHKAGVLLNWKDGIYET